MGVCLGDRGNRNPGACGALGLVPCAVVWLVCNLGEMCICAAERESGVGSGGVGNAVPQIPYTDTRTRTRLARFRETRTSDDQRSMLSEADGDARAEQPPQGDHAGDSPAPDHHFCVLPSGRLAFRLPDTKAGKQVWLDVVRRVKLCPCGHSMIEMHHWRCAARPRAKPEWVQCQCDSKGLFTNPKAKPELPADVEVPSYASVLWRDSAPKVLQPANVLAVRVPGKPKGIEVWIDALGRARCAHGFTESGLLRAHQMRKQQAATVLQDWWRRLGFSERGAVREALLRGAQAPPSDDLERAAVVWRQCSMQRREDVSEKKRERGRPAPKPCGCRTGGLRREMFGTLQRRKRPAIQSTATADTNKEHNARMPTKKARNASSPVAGVDTSRPTYAGSGAMASTDATDATAAAAAAAAEARVGEAGRSVLMEFTNRQD